MNMNSTDVLVIGTGPVGYSAALALAQSGRKVALIGTHVLPARDGRTVALLDGSVNYLTSLGLWDAISATSAPLSVMRMLDDTGSLFRPPPVSFKASELGLKAFGYNVELTDLVRVLTDATKLNSDIVRVHGQVLNVNFHNTGDCIVTLDSNTQWSAPLIVGADGRNSVVRRSAEIAIKEWSYPQTALTAILSHQRDHDDISTEFHTREGPFTLVPLPGRRSSLVWMMERSRAIYLASLDSHAFQLEVEKRAKSMLGKMVVEGLRGELPMSGMLSAAFSSGQAALVGEAAHLFPPIGAQGLNLGFRDVRSLAIALSKANVPNALRNYDTDRRADITLRTLAVDLLNRSLLTDFLPLDLARSLGLLTIASLPPLRRLMMRRGAGH